MNSHAFIIIHFLIINSIIAQQYQEIVDFRETKEVTHYITGAKGNYIVSDALKKSSISHLKTSLNDKKPNKTYHGGYAILLLYKDHGIEHRTSSIVAQSKSRLMFTVKEQEVKTNNYSRVGIKRLNYSPDDESLSLPETRKLLKTLNISYISLFYVRTRGKDVIAALVKYGTETKHYAVYGIWKNEKEAKKYGYKAGDRIYMSAPMEITSIPDTSGIVKTIIDMGIIDKGNGETANILVNEVAGAKHWTYQEVIKNKEIIFDQLYWKEYPLNSEMPTKYDADGIAIKDNNGNVPPPGPDSYSTTTNPPPTNNCPDMETYFDLYCQCVKPILDTEYKEEKSAAAHYVDYKDFLGKTLMEEDWDGTVYNENGMVGSQEISTEFQPEQPYLFDKNCNLINKNMPKMYDPFTHKLALINVKWGHIKGFHFGHIAHTKDLTNQIRPVLNEVIQFYETYLRHDPRSLVGVKHLHGSIKINDEQYLNENLYMGNPVDKYRPYEKPEFFVIFDNHYVADGKPLRTEVKYKKGDDAVRADNDRKDWYITWSWPVIFKDKFGIKRIAGTVNYKQHFYRESGKLEKRGQKFKFDHFKDGATGDVIGTKKKHRCNTHIYIIGTGETQKFAMSSYNKNSKDYYTDQYDISERDPDIEKNEALQEIILKIAVAEGLNLVMKGLYKLAEKKKQAIPLYEAGKRLENRLTQSRTYKIAKELYKTYATWKTTMDLLKECRDTYRSIGQAWDGLMYSMFSLKEYYKNMDYKKVRLTNITCMLPMRHLKSIDADLYTLQTSLNDFQLAIDAMAFQSDMIVKGHYGPLKPLIFVVTQSLKDIKLSSGVSTTEIIKSNTERLNNITQNTGETASEACYLSNVTATIQTLTAINRETLVNDRLKAMGCALLLTESESRDWMEYANFMQSIPQNFDNDITNGELKKAPLSCIIRNTFHKNLFSKENELVLKRSIENK